MLRFFSSDAPKLPDQYEESRKLLISLTDKHPTVRDELQLLERDKIQVFLDELELEISNQTSNPFTKARIKTSLFALKSEFADFYELLSLTPSHMMIMHMLILDANAENEAQIKTLHFAHKKLFAAIKKQITIAADPIKPNQAMLTYFYERLTDIISLSSNPKNINHPTYHELYSAASRTQKISHDEIESLKTYADKCKEDIVLKNGYLVKTYHEFTINNFDDFYRAILSLKEENKPLADNYIFFDDYNLQALRCHLDIFYKIDFYLSPEEKEMLSKGILAKHKLSFKAMPAEGADKKPEGTSIADIHSIAKACRFAQSRDSYEAVIHELNNPSLYTALSMQGSGNFTAIAKIKLNWERRLPYASLPVRKLKKLADTLDALTDYLTIIRECLQRVDIINLSTLFYVNKPHYYVNTLTQLIESVEKVIANERCKLSQAMLCRLEIESSGHSDVVLATLEELQAVGIRKAYVEKTKKILPKSLPLSDEESDYFKYYIQQYGNIAQQDTLMRLEESRRHTMTLNA